MNLPLEVLVVCIAFLGFNCLRVDAICYIIVVLLSVSIYIMTQC